MAKKGLRGFVNRMLIGKEKSEGYARASLPSNRWELFWDIFKGRFWKLVIVNLLVALFFIPLIALIIIKYIAVQGYGASYPFSQGFGVGYMAFSMTAAPERIILDVNMTVYLFLPIALLVAAVGISGGAYVIRNMVWTEGIFVSNDFWRGIKLNFKKVLLIMLFFSIFFYAHTLMTSLCDYIIATGNNLSWLMYICKVISYIVMVLVSMMSLHMITMGVTYEVKFFQLLKNSFLLTIGLFPQNLFFIIVGGIPIILCLLGGVFLSFGVVLMLFIGFSLFFLIWTDYSQWIYDKFLNDKVPGAKKNRGIYEKVKATDSEALKKYKEQMILTKSTLASRPIKPITDEELKLSDLPTQFTREDLRKLDESKQIIYADNEKYIEEHKNDAEFMKTEEDIEREKLLLEHEKKIENAKRELAKRNKNKRR